jgi:hypothetical protein
VNCTELVLCDQCWHLAGGSRTISARLRGAPPDNGGDEVYDARAGLEPVVVFPPVVEALLAGMDAHDVLHPIDRLLVESGVRWAVLRHIAVPARMQLAGLVLCSAPAEGTRAADSAGCWLAEVEARIRAQSGGRGSGAEFIYAAKRRRWWRVARVFAAAADRDRRPLTWRAQDDVAAEVGCDVSTVGRVVAWLRAEGLLWELVPGCQLPQQHVPDDETLVETSARRARMLAAVAAEQAARARARAELDAGRVGHRGPAAVAAAQLVLDDDSAAAVPPAFAEDLLKAAAAVGTEITATQVTAALEFDQALTDVLDPPLVRLAPVYELRVSAPPPTTGPPLALPGARPLTDAPSTPADIALASNNNSASEAYDEFADPPQVIEKDQKSRPVHPVEKSGRAPRDPYKEVVGRTRWCAPLGTPPDGAEQPADGPEPPLPGSRGLVRQSEAVRVAAWLLRSRLDAQLCEGVSLRWLAAQIRGAHLLDRHGWSWDDLADLLHGAPEHPHLPRHVRNPRGWIRARFAGATPTLPPSSLRQVLDIERRSGFFRQRRAETSTASASTAAAARRAAIDACPLCDELGWLHVPDGVPVPRCTHDPTSAGW